MDTDPTLASDRDYDSAPLEITDSLFHYTGAETAIFGLLSSGKLRLSPFESTNDLWESRPTYHALQSHKDDEDVLNDETIDLMDLWKDIDRQIRRTTKVACLTQDFDMVGVVHRPDMMRGWNHLSMWAHYGAGHRGICLQFDKSRLISELEGSASEEVQIVHGPVVYRSGSSIPMGEGIDLGQVREFGVDAVARLTLMRLKEALFLQKHRDWQSEYEYRLVLSDHSALPAFLPIKEAITGVYLGESFPKQLLPALKEVLFQYPHVEVFELNFMNRELRSSSFQFADAMPSLSHPWVVPRRSGSFPARVTELLEAEKRREQLHAQGETDARILREQIEFDLLNLTGIVSRGKDLRVEPLRKTSAIPSEMRRRSAGVPGEVVHFESGVLISAQSTRDPAHYLLFSAALQVLEGNKIRLHTVAMLENLTESPQHQRELWRDSDEVELVESLPKWERMYAVLSERFPTFWGSFEEMRR
ncbi:hypothetical protein GCM10009847_04980 [Leucobacter tardus]|uniref:DUF2971 domain-containing protein n=1 Tax=Leucobacter tardus TaxID=501483 RepID=A0A939QJ78_9MICO|nr:DUF2971 domain-containing protein [Leucobacter tardus]MBO2988704.1 DUF2971 domain-containing protein [Leucobacter tardus]